MLIAMKNIKLITLAAISISLLFASCGQQESSKSSGALNSSAAEKVYVAPGEHDEYYAFLSGGYSGNLTVYGLPSGRMFKEIPVFSQFPTSGWSGAQAPSQGVPRPPSLRRPDNDIRVARSSPSP